MFVIKHPLLWKYGFHMGYAIGNLYKPCSNRFYHVTLNSNYNFHNGICKEIAGVIGLD